MKNESLVDSTAVEQDYFTRQLVSLVSIAIIKIVNLIGYGPSIVQRIKEEIFEEFRKSFPEPCRRTLVTAIETLDPNKLLFVESRRVESYTISKVKNICKILFEDH